MKRPKLGRVYWLVYNDVLYLGRCVAADDEYTVFNVDSSRFSSVGLDNKGLENCLRCEGVDWWWLRLWRWLFAPAELEQGDW